MNKRANARIEAIEPYVSNGRLQFLNSWNQDYPLLIGQHMTME